MCQQQVVATGTLASHTTLVARAIVTPVQTEHSTGDSNKAYLRCNDARNSHSQGYGMLQSRVLCLLQYVRQGSPASIGRSHVVVMQRCNSVCSERNKIIHSQLKISITCSQRLEVESASDLRRGRRLGVRTYWRQMDVSPVLLCCAVYTIQ
jgi:hypothetical protein